jgi:transposase-like protein
MTKTFTIHQFYEMFPDDDSCLDHVMKVRFGTPAKCPKCEKVSNFHRLRKELSYACQWCGHRIFPMVGTPFENTHTPLQKWFYAMYLFTTTRHGVPAKELQRQLGVTYKTAWRMGHEIRKHMLRVDGNPPLSGHVEIDETRIGGKDRGSRGGSDARPKVIVMGMLQRGGNLMTRIVEAVDRRSLYPHILLHVKPGTTISTDELQSYATLGKKGYTHGTVNHSADEYVRGIHHVNGVEGAWSIVKRSIRGTHVHVSRKHLWKYLGEFEFRYNMRKQPGFMFARLLMSFSVPASGSSSTPASA